MIRETVSSDAEAILAIVASSGEFDAASIDHIKETLENYLEGASDGLWFTADDGEPVGVAYCAPEPVTVGTWNLLMLWTRQDRGGKGHGSALVQHVEQVLTDRGARLLIVETSGLAEYETARAFYSKCGFTQEARVRDFYSAGDDKLVYTKALRSAAPAG